MTCRSVTEERARIRCVCIYGSCREDYGWRSLGREATQPYQPFSAGLLMNDDATRSEFPLIDIDSDTFFMREALRLAHRAAREDEVPVGAVVVAGGQIIARAWNQVEQLLDATAHAEMLAITQAAASVGDWRLTDCDFYV
ncbi:MAG: deaminase, partial [Verrucomicrobiia bacterium]